MSELSKRQNDTADRDDLAALLDKHRRAPWEFASPEKVTNPIIPFHRCTCGDREVFIESETDLDRHRAQMVLESDWLRDVRAGAWDECIKPFRHYGFTNRNPYRADRVDAEDGGR